MIDTSANNSNRSAGADEAQPAPDTDERLLEAHLAGNEVAFRQLVERYHRELFHFLVRFLGDRATAEDVFQEAFLQVHQSARQFDTSRRFRPWLFTIAANKARDLLRAQSRRPVSALQTATGDEEGGELLDLIGADTELPAEPLEQEELRQQVRRIIQQMPAHLREILLLSYFHQFSYKQMSDMLDIPLGTVKSRIHAAVRNFAGRWEDSQNSRRIGDR